MGNASGGKRTWCIKKKVPWLFKRETKHGLVKRKEKRFYTVGTEKAQAGRETLLTVKEEYQIQCPKYSRYTTKCIAIIQHHSE